MFFTRSIRRKISSGLVLVLIMLGLLVYASISGLSSYLSVVEDLDYSINKAPRRSDLEAAVAPLFEPLLMPPDAKMHVIQAHQKAFLERLGHTQEMILDFREKLETLPRTPGALARQPVTNAILGDVDRRLNYLQYLNGQLSVQPNAQEVAEQMLTELAAVQTLIQRIPDPQLSLHSALNQAQRVYDSRMKWITILTISVVVLFAGLILGGYLWVVRPIRLLHQGARRVANRDLHFRLKIQSNDEMAELAEAFNQMTQQFLEIKEDLDQQVQERSQQLVRSERLASVGFLAAGVAHEINNPLFAIMTAAESLQERVGEAIKHQNYADLDVAADYLELIQEEASRCKTITSKLLDFSRGQDTTRTRCDVTRIIEEVISLIEHMKKFRNRRIRFDHQENCFLEVNGPEIKQVVLNIVANGLEAMEDGGTLTIDILERTSNVMIRFQDDGCGMTPEVIHNLFEPFFTQKKNGKGTGLGMSISHRIVTDHGGTIRATSEGEGKGSVFQVTLPRKATQSEAAA